MSSSLRTIVLVGPRLAGADSGTPSARAYTWTASLKLAFQGKGRADQSVVNSTQGMRVVLQSPRPDVGPGLPGTGTAGTLDVSVSLMSPQLVQLIAGPTSGGESPVVQFCAAANSVPMPTSYVLFADATTDKPGTRGMDGLLAVPDERWPMPQSGREIDVPRMRLVEGRLSVLFDAAQPAGAPPFGFLGLVQDKLNPDAMLAFASAASAGSAQLPFVRLPIVTNTQVDAKPHRFVRIDLTPEGIEFEAEVANPRRSLDTTVATAASPAVPAPTLKLRLRLANRAGPDGGDSWALYPVDDGKIVRDRSADYVEIGAALDALQDAISASRTLDVGIDTHRRIPPVCWPLDLTKDALRPVYRIDQATSRADWCIELRDGLSTMLAADAADGGELPTTSDLTADSLRFTAVGTGTPAAAIRLDLFANRRPDGFAGAAQAVGRVPPNVSIDLAIDVDSVTHKRSFTRMISIVPDSAAQSVAWTLDEYALATDLVSRYTRAGVQPGNAATTYAFVPVNGGWLQWPLRLRPTDAPRAPTGTLAGTVPLDGELVFALDTPAARSPTDKTMPDLVGGRRVRLTACDTVRAQASFRPGDAGDPLTLTALHIDLGRCTGEASGLLWFATSSPTPAEILPSLAAGPLALQSAWLDFGRWQQAPDGTRTMQSGALVPRANQGFDPLTLTLNVTGEEAAPTRAVLWQNADGLPVVTAVAMTRTSDGGTTPLSTRQLLPHALDLSRSAITLAFKAGALLPDANPTTSGLLHPEVWGPLTAFPSTGPAPAQPTPELWSGVPLVAVTLPGIEFQASEASFTRRAMRLQYGLPVLDELWTLARLPQTNAADAPLMATVTPRVTFPTSLDLDALRDTWLSARDRLMLTRTQACIVSPGWIPQQASNQTITNLFEGATWQTTFELATPVTLGDTVYPFGTYDIGGAEPGKNTVTAADALAGHGGRFRLTGNDLAAVPDGPDAPETLRVVGFAVALLDSPLAATPAWRDTRGTITARLSRDVAGEAIILREMGSALDGGFPWKRATLRKPITIAVPDAAPLTFWFRDLPLASPAKLGDATVEATLINPIAFRPDAGPRALGRPELAIGPTPDVLDPAWMPSSTYEWRFAATPAAPDGQASFVIALGPLSFQPLRLFDVTLDQAAGGYAVFRIAILGTLAATDPTAAVPPAADGPFGDDMACATGSPVVLTLERAPDGSFSLAAATWSAVALDLDGLRWTRTASAPPPQTLTLRIPDLDAGTRSQTSALLTLTLTGRANDRGWPTFAPATAMADVVLLGRLCTLTTGTTDYSTGDLSIEFDFKPTPTQKCGLEVRAAVFTLAARHLALSGLLIVRWAAASKPGAGASLAAIALNMVDPTSSLRWLNHDFGVQAAVIDHAIGLIEVDVNPSQQTITALTPVAGMSVANATGLASLRVVFPLPSPSPSPLIPFTGNFDAACALGLLDYASQPAQDSTPNGVTAFRHVVRLDDRASPVSSEIELDLDWTTTSLIEWPLDSIAPTSSVTPGAPWPLLADVDGHAMQITQKPDPAPRRHSLRLVVTRAPLDTALLCWSGGTRTVDLPGGGTQYQIALEQPWVLRARARHEIRNAADAAPVLAWTAIDHVVISGTRALMEAAWRDHKPACAPNETRVFGFAARYQTVSDAPSTDKGAEKSKASPSFVKAGLGLRQYASAGFPTEPIAHALLDQLPFGDQTQDGTLTGIGTGPWVEGMVANGAGPVAIHQMGGDTGFFLALPWIATLTTDADSFKRIMPPLHQVVPAGAAPVTWAVPDIDVACTAPQHLSFAPALALALSSAAAADMDRALEDALASVRGLGLKQPEPSRALMPVEQVFLQPVGKSQRMPVDVQPLWLRSLLTLRGVLFGTPRIDMVDGLPKIEQIVVSGRSDGTVCRLTLKAPATPGAAKETTLPFVPNSLQLLALGRDGLGVATLGTADTATLVSNGELDTVGPHVRLLARADTLVGATVCALLTLRPDARGRLQWQPITAPAPRDDPLLAPPLPLQNERAFASPNLGWPSTGVGVVSAAAASLGMGDDRPFQDKYTPAPANGPDDSPGPDTYDVKTYGSGFSGRVARLSLPARADPQEPAAASFYVHGHKTLLLWPSQVTLATPPARHLSTSYARLRLPGPDDALRALNAYDTTIPIDRPGAVQPLVPPTIERTTYGSRPGALHAEFDALALRDWKPLALAGDAQARAYPGHVGPMLTRQVRAPRGVELPRLPLLAASSAIPAQATSVPAATATATTRTAIEAVPTMVETHGRRTFIAADDMLDPKTRQPTPFRLFDGVANVLRTVNGEGQVESLHLVVPGLLQIVGAPDLSIRIEVSSPTVSLAPSELQATLIALGLLPSSGVAAPSAALTVGNASAAFGRVEVMAPTKGLLSLTLHFAKDKDSVPSVAANTVCRLLETADGDTPVVLTYIGTNPVITAAAAAIGVAVPPAGNAQATDPAPGTESAASTPAPPPVPWIVPLRMLDAADQKLTPEPRQKLLFRLPVQPRVRATMAVRVSTLAFCDPAYDRLLSGPGASSQQRSADGVAWKLAFDRFVYSLDTPLYFAFGSIVAKEPAPNAAHGNSPLPKAGAFDPAPSTARLGIKRLRGGLGAPPSAVPLCIACVLAAPDDQKEGPTYDLDAAKPYALTLDALLTTGASPTFDLQAGDLLMFSLTRYKPTDPTQVDLQLEVVVRLASQSVVPPSPAVYSLVTATSDPAQAVVALHAARPLPQRIEMPHLVEDLAIGHIRRSALFEWGLPRAAADAIKWATLVKVDSAGGGQMPSQVEDLVRQTDPKANPAASVGL